jgi:hypothetical protein
MTRSSIRTLLVPLLLFSATFGKSQQPPKNDRTGNPVFIVRNDASTATTIEYRTNNQWQAIKLDSGMDASISGDHIRVSTAREDGAMVTIDLPTQAGKKYRLFWNTQTSTWDFSKAP